MVFSAAVAAAPSLSSFSFVSGAVPEGAAVTAVTAVNATFFTIRVSQIAAGVMGTSSASILFGVCALLL